MPIGNPHRAYTKQEVETVSANDKGVYAIYRLNGTCVYVGNGPIRAKLLAHLADDPRCINDCQASSWNAELGSGLEAREKQLIAELKPTCNEE